MTSRMKATQKGSALSQVEADTAASEIERLDVEDLSGGERDRVLVTVSEKQYAHLKSGHETPAMIENANEAIRSQILLARGIEASLREKYPDIAAALGYPAFFQPAIVEADVAAREQYEPTMIVFVKDDPLIDTYAPNDQITFRSMGGRPLKVAGGHGSFIGYAFRAKQDEMSKPVLFIALNRSGAIYWSSLKQPVIDRFISIEGTIGIVEGAIYGVAG